MRGIITGISTGNETTCLTHKSIDACSSHTIGSHHDSPLVQCVRSRSLEIVKSQRGFGMTMSAGNLHESNTQAAVQISSKPNSKGIRGEFFPAVRCLPVFSMFIQKHINHRI